MAVRQKPATAAWIQRERKRLGLSTRELSERLALIGVRVGEQTISVWESYAGRNPSADNLDALERLFGSKAPERADGQGDVAATLAAAIDRQTDALLSAIRDREAALARRDEEIAALLQELADYRQEAAKARIVEQSLIEALPAAIAHALVQGLRATREADREVEPPAPAPPRASGR